MIVLDCLKPLTLSAVGNDNGMLYETSLLLFANARGAGTPLTVKCPSLGHIVKQMPGVCSGGPGGYSQLELTRT